MMEGGRSRNTRLVVEQLNEIAGAPRDGAICLEIDKRCFSSSAFVFPSPISLARRISKGKGRRSE